MTRARGVSPRRLALVLAILAALAGVALAAWLLFAPREDAVRLEPFPQDSTDTVSFAGELPAKGTLPAAKGLTIRRGRLYVAVADAAAIRVSALDGSRPTTIALAPAEPGVPSYPVDVAVLPDDRLVVIDTAGNRVLVLSSAGKVEATIGGAASGGEDEDAASGGRLLAPTAVEVGADRIFVADGGDHTIKAYRTDGTFVRVMAEGLVPRLAFVGGLAYGNGDLYVSDSANARVLVLDAGSGAQTATLQQRFDLPRGVETWPGGVLVADVFGRRVTVLDAQGAPTDSLPGESKEGALASPEDVAFDADSGRAYVSDSVLGNVLVYNVRTEREARGAE